MKLTFQPDLCLDRTVLGVTVFRRTLMIQLILCPVSPDLETKRKITENAGKLKNFVNNNNMSINLGKTEVIEIMVQQKRARLPGVPPQLVVETPDGNLKHIAASDSCRLLGANLDKDMSWHVNMDTGQKALIPALRSKIGALSHIAKFMPKHSRLLLANGLILSKLLYLITVWGGAPASYLKRLQALLNKTDRIVTGLLRKTRTSTLMTECKW